MRWWTSLKQYWHFKFYVILPKLASKQLFPDSSPVNAGCRNACPLYIVVHTADAVSACNTRFYNNNTVLNILSGPQNWGTLYNSSFILPFPSKSLGHSRFSMNINIYPRDRTAPSLKGEERSKKSNRQWNASWEESPCWVSCMYHLKLSQLFEVTEGTKAWRSSNLK